MEQTRVQELVARHASSEGVHDTPFDGVQLFRLCKPVERLAGVYSPSLCIIVQGSKRAYLGDAAFTYDHEHYMCATMPLPVEGEVPHATPEKPVLGLLISLETRAMAEMLIEYEAGARPLPNPKAAETIPGLVVAAWSEAFVTALLRLLQLLDDPLSVRLLGPGRLRELFFAVIQGKAGPMIRHSFGTSHNLSRALSYLRNNLEEPLSIDDLAEHAGMSRAVFDRRFREATTHSPLQFIKLLRLSEAAMHIAQGMPISQAAESVGYGSASQFSREFKRHFGKSPRQWGKGAAREPFV
ncbi:AraC family transcriptional regulator [Sulfidibacter corallicola]|uniref:AraC family transcriptional regulator n=1 Tax=Sulfidibacter corallicola TaxID=2818388 RepID=A0A8A4TM40_SULCO|nr:AraC family transcriptional regulator [Sulfidibacter corallicola]QTD50630.1 AraC family transcriptional regulator [Sulfidibacter corallicola]